MFRYRDKLGMDLALEVLKEYFSKKKFNIPRLLEYAEICQVKTILTPLLKVLV